jgi:lysophospholipase L1-like esterase
MRIQAAWIAALFSLTAGVSAADIPAAATASSSTSASQKPVRVVLCGDSTVTDHAGWGLAFTRRLAPPVTCFNGSRSGNSSRSFYNNGSWKKALAEKPTHVLIQFGHNDQPGKGPERETDPATSYREFLAKYIDEARSAGAVPILVTSVVRRNRDAEGKIIATLAPWAEAAKAVGKEKNVPVVDLHGRSLEFLNRIGAEGSAKFDPPHPDRPGLFDRTHLNEAGAAAMADLVIDELKRVLPESRSWFAEK